AERGPVVGPISAFDDEHVVRIDRANGSTDALVEWPKLRSIERQEIGGGARQRLVQKIVSENDGMVCKSAGDLGPQRDESILVRRIGKERRTVVGVVVDVRSGLPSGRAVHVENDVQALPCAPIDDVLQMAK